MRKGETELVGISERGKRVGGTHPRAKLTDADIDLMRELHEEHGMTYTVLAQKFECSKSTAWDVCNYRRRIAYAVTWKQRGPA